MSERNLDSPQRYQIKKKWYPNREHRGGVGGGDYDFMGDESLYKAGELGQAFVYPDTVYAGEQTHGFSITYRCGERGLNAGDAVSFTAKGIAPLGCDFQAEDPNRPGYFRCKHPAHCKTEPIYQTDWKATFPIGIKVTQGTLTAGDELRIEVPGENGNSFSWTRLAGRKEIKVVIREAGISEEKRLPQPLVVSVLPSSPAALEVTTPCTRLKEQKSIDAVVTLRDRFDNRVPANTTVVINENKHVPMREGLASCTVDVSAGTTRIQAVLPDGSLSGVSHPNVPCSEYQLYIGDLHCHDLLSEAEGYPDEVYRWAIEDRRFDFVAVSPQSHGWHDNETWTVTKLMNERFHCSHKFVTFLSFEWQHSSYGDKIIHYVGGNQPCLYVDDPRYDTPAKLYKVLKQSDCFIISHHPGYPLSQWVPGTDYEEIDPELERVIELWSMHGSSEGHDPNGRPLKSVDPRQTVMEALRRGKRLGFVGGSDTHKGRPGGSLEGQNPPNWGGMAAVWAAGLTRPELFDAIVNRRTYALSRSRIIAVFKVNGAWMGSEIEFSPEAFIEIDVWAPSIISDVEIIKNTLTLETIHVGDNEVHFKKTYIIKRSAFFHCRVTLEDRNCAVCSPVWIG
jgi:hypothetical protein